MGKRSRGLVQPGPLVAGLLVLVLSVLAAASGEGVRWPDTDRPAPAADQREGGAEEVDEPVDPEPGEDPSVAPDDDGAVRWTGPGRWAALALLAALVLLAVALVGRLRVSLRRGRREAGTRIALTAPPAPAEDVMEDDDALEGALRAGIADLASGPPRNSIVAAWLRLEEAAESTRFHRDPADTPSEFAAHVLASYDLDTAAIERLATLYREARFSEHPMGVDQREEALGCLTRLLAGLRSPERPLRRGGGP